MYVAVSVLLSRSPTRPVCCTVVWQQCYMFNPLLYDTQINAIGHVSAASENITALADLRVVIGDYDRSVVDFNRRTVLIEVTPLVALKNTVWL